MPIRDSKKHGFAVPQFFVSLSLGLDFRDENDKLFRYNCIINLQNHFLMLWAVVASSPNDLLMF